MYKLSPIEICRIYIQENVIGDTVKEYAHDIFFNQEKWDEFFLVLLPASLFFKCIVTPVS